MLLVANKVDRPNDAPSAAELHALDGKPHPLSPFMARGAEISWTGSSSVSPAMPTRLRRRLSA